MPVGLYVDYALSKGNCSQVEAVEVTNSVVRLTSIHTRLVSGQDARIVTCRGPFVRWSRDLGQGLAIAQLNE
jgi:hypothetical protein